MTSDLSSDAQGATVFVARSRELARLEKLLVTALSGELSVCFVTGEAGSGKTALLTEFARRAADADPDLVFALGDCNAQAGTGDPYLPFREILRMLTGDIDGKLAEGAITESNARRLRGHLQASARTVSEFGPALIDVFVPGSALAAQVGARVARKLGWLRDNRGEPVASPSGSRVSWERDQIFEQFTNVIRTLSEEQPLALIVDDLHWADSGSIDLLFHLCRRLGKSRVLLIGAYRPADLMLQRSGDRHPLQQVANELKRYFGDVWIELDGAGPVEERAIVDAMIDREPNRLEADFRRALLERTNGHPLFTDELLRALRERGDLTRDRDGMWVEAGTIRWDAVPPRVEGLIGERIGRLPAELRDVLEVAAVEGEDFTAEAIASVLSISPREVIRMLSRSLDREHQLVGARGVRRIAGHRLSLYRFRHNLFQAYLYDTLDEVERVQLHEDLGQALATLYASELDDIAARLARHAKEAGDSTAAVEYLWRAGQRARRSYANAEARDHFENALRMLEAEPGLGASVTVDEGSSGPLQARLWEGLADVHTVGGAHETAREALVQAGALYRPDDQLARARLTRKVGDSLVSQNRWADSLDAFAEARLALGDEPEPTNVDWWLEWIDLRIGVVWSRYFLGQADEIARLADELGEVAERYGTPAQRGAVFNCLILAAFRRERYATSDTTLALAREAVDFATEAGDLLLRVATQFQFAFCHLWRDEFEQAERELKTSLKLAERAGWVWHQILSYTYLAILYRRLSDVARASEFTRRAMEAARATGLPTYVGVAWANESWLAWRKGDLEEARQAAEKALELWSTGGAYPIQWTALWPLTTVALESDSLSEAIDHARTLLDPGQQKLPDALAVHLREAIERHEGHDSEGARAALQQAVAGATEAGYL